MKILVLFIPIFIFSLFLTAQTTDSILHKNMDRLKSQIKAYGDSVAICNVLYIEHEPQMEIDVFYQNQKHNDCIIKFEKYDTMNSRNFKLEWIPDNDLMALKISCSYCIEYNDTHLRGAEFDFVRVFFVRKYFEKDTGLQSRITKAIYELRKM